MSKGAIFSSGAGELHPAYKILLAKLQADGLDLPTQIMQQQDSDMLWSLDAAGIWNRLDVFYLLGWYHGTAALYNWKNPNLFMCQYVNDMSIADFSANSNYHGNGTGKALSTGWIPMSHSVNYTTNDAHVMRWSNTNTADLGIEVGCNTGDTDRKYLQMATKYSGLSGQTANYLNSQVGSIGGPWDVSETFILNRLSQLKDESGNVLDAAYGSTKFEEYAKGIRVNVKTAPATGLATHELTIFGMNNGDDITDYSPKPLRYLSAGGGLTQSQCGKYQQILKKRAS